MEEALRQHYRNMVNGNLEHSQHYIIPPLQVGSGVGM
jgi:hypothetical protein